MATAEMVMTAADVQMITITPGEAADMLAVNTHNRRIRRGLVEQLAGAMRRGEWMFNGDAIRIGDSGVLLDGQHRLAAVVASGLSQQFLVITGLPDAAQETMDTGAKRSVADLLKLRGETDVNRLAAVVRLIHYYETRQTMRHPIILPTNLEVIAALERHPGARTAVVQTRPVIKNTQLAGGPAGACYYLFSLVDEADTEAFFTRLALGTELVARSPIHALRRRFLEPRIAHRIMPHFQGALMIKAFNMWRRGEEASHIRYRPGGALAEKFPLVDGLEMPKP